VLPFIKPRIDEGGEPVCDRGCPRYFPEGRDDCPFAHLDHDCVLGLRQQRDEAMRAYCEVRGITLKPPKTEREIALMVYGLLVADRLYPLKEV
jgi:hypothetical protein